ncbi:hypothetical protein HPP92_016999 [Vanilla planifolia]|uniref:Uncharacterized protein n=1 Tax=Vanilla planifolia TaxID=51239 RepID=A0A835QJ51_VANPL|nr:hypothetical protein HPP92_016999 [Vanilla planifolia]
MAGPKVKLASSSLCCDFSADEMSSTFGTLGLRVVILDDKQIKARIVIKSYLKASCPQDILQNGFSRKRDPDSLARDRVIIETENK